MSQYLFYCINMMMNTFLIRTRCNKGRSSIHHLRWNRITCRILNIIVSPLPIDSSMQGMMSKLKITVGKTITTHMKPFFSTKFISKIQQRLIPFYISINNIFSTSIQTVANSGHLVTGITSTATAHLLM